MGLPLETTLSIQFELVYLHDVYKFNRDHGFTDLD